MLFSPRLHDGLRRTWLLQWGLLVAVSFLSLYLAYQIRFEFQIPVTPVDWRSRMWETMAWVLPFELLILIAAGHFSPLVARIRFRDFVRIFATTGVITAFLIYLWFVFDGESTPPRLVIILNGLLLLLGLLGIGSISGHFRSIVTGNFSEVPMRASRILAVGESFLAHQLVVHSRTRSGLGLRVVGLVTTNGRRRIGGLWQGVPVAGPVEEIEAICRRFDPDRVVVTDPRLPTERLRDLVRSCRRWHIPVHIVPTAQEMFYGVLRVNAIRPVGLEDVLGRSALEVDLPRIHRMIAGRRVMVTGAGGSIGSELCRQILAYGPETLLLLDYSEPALFAIEQQIRSLPGGERAKPLLINVRDRAEVRATFENERPELIFHSAALKHVSMVETFPNEGLKTNTLATDEIAGLADEAGVERMVFISTDKAINPTSLMGASKRFAEQLMQSRSQNGTTTAFVAVRFGNVIGSSGSVVPIFENQIAAGGPITVTHPDVQRYFMSIPEAVGLVLQSASQGQGGDVFMLDMGQPLRVLDVARQMIELRGLEPGEDIEIEIIGLRPGEKLYEELRYDAEIHAPTDHPRVYRLTTTPLSSAAADELRQRIREVAGLTDRETIRKAVIDLLPEFIAEAEPEAVKPGVE